MESSVTRIADLPLDNNSLPSNKLFSNELPPNTMSMSKQKQNKIDNDVQTNYIPINIHPNPYGVSAQNPIMEAGQSSNYPRTEQYNPSAQPVYLSPEQMQQLNEMGHQRLPSRDIVQHTGQYSHDEEVQPNYIPPPPQKNDFVREHYELTEKRLQEYEENKRKESKLDNLLTEIQTPLLVAILFFLFQLPAINTMIFKRFSFLSLYDVDGNFNLFGLIVKSLLFGGTYYSLRTTMNYLSEF